MLIFNALYVNANPVDQKTAAEIGAKYLTASVGMRATVSDMQLAKTYFMDNGDAAFYVFNTVNGFVIVSAQDVATPILGYSDEAMLDINDIPEAMEWWLGEYVNQIQYCVENDVVPFDKTVEEWELVRKTGKLNNERALTAVSPLVETTWHQDWPYNKFCPTAETPEGSPLNGHTYAGCVACAMSQVMRFWNYPQTGAGEIRREPYLNSSPTIDLSQVTYDWANMPLTLSDSPSETQIDAVATLMYHAGIAVKMNYSVGGSSCNDEDRVAQKLKDNFLYDDELGLEKLTSYTASDLARWKVILRSSLDQGCPIPYTAADDKPNSTAGHAFVVDGYNNDGEFHINWGYAGNGNGYFPVGGFNTGGYQYNHACNAIVNMHPKTTLSGDPWPTTVFSINASVDASGHGSVSGGGDHNYGATVTLTATPETGYGLAYWMEEGVIVSTDATYSFTATYNRTIEAHFTQPGNITVVANDPTFGTVTGGGQCTVNTNTTLTATANTGYIFENWSKDGFIVSTDNPYTFKVTESAAYTANFRPLEGDYIGDNSTNNSAYAPSCVMYEYSVSEQIYTKAQIGGSGDIYSISFFNMGSSSYKTDITRTLDIYMINTAKSSFSSTTDWITGFTSMDRCFSGEVTFEYGSWTTIFLDDSFYYNGSGNMAIIVYDYTGNTGTSHNFKTYNGGANTVIYTRGSGAYDPTDMSDITTTAYNAAFKNQIIINKAAHTASSYTINADALPEGSGIITGAGTYAYEDPCTLTATPDNSSLVFRYWTKNGKIMSENPTYSFTVKGNASLVAVFAGPSTVSTSVNPVGTGTVTGGGEYIYGSTCTLSATAAENYVFNKWTVNGEVVSTNEIYEFEVTEDVDIVANFRSVDMIAFADPNVKELCVDKWDSNSDGELSTTEAAAVENIGEVFKDHYEITSFNEFQYFTGLTSIPMAAFRGCSHMTEITLPQGITTIGSTALSGCTLLSSIIIPDGVTNIEATAFNGCTSLDGLLIIPSSVTSIGTDAFRNCSGIDMMIVKCATPPIVKHDSAFENWNFSIPVYVPNGTISAYRSATKGWEQFTNYLNQVPTSGGSVPAAGDVFCVDGNYTLTTEASAFYTYFTNSTNVLTIGDGGVLTVSEDIAIDNASQLVVEDGGQLIVTTPGIMATVRKPVKIEYDKGVGDHWYTISSPVKNAKIAGDDANTNLTTGTYDLYRYNESTHMWENYNNSDHDHFNNMLENGRGYLYRNAANQTIEFSGEVNVNQVNVAVTNNGATLAGFNLIGNPYSHNIYKGDGTAILNSKEANYQLATGFYYVTNYHDWQPGLDNIDAIKPGEGILVEAITAGVITMTNETADRVRGKSDNDYLQFMVSNDKYEDIAYALFDQGYGLDKIDHLNDKAPMLYISMDARNYAIATMDEDIQSFDLGFEAKTMGKYTLSVNMEGDFGYIHLFDKLTGEDVDILREESYSFIGSPNDRNDRFVVSLNFNTSPSTGSAAFVWQSGNEIIVNGEGELQIFDITGRMVSTQHVSGTETMYTSSLQNGVYIFRLVGTEVKTQKIIVK